MAILEYIQAITWLWRHYLVLHLINILHTIKWEDLLMLIIFLNITVPPIPVVQEVADHLHQCIILCILLHSITEVHRIRTEQEAFRIRIRIIGKVRTVQREEEIVTTTIRITKTLITLMLTILTKLLILVRVRVRLEPTCLFITYHMI